MKINFNPAIFIPIFIFLFIICFFSLKADENCNIKNNFDVLDSIAELSVEDIYNKIKILNQEKSNNIKLNDTIYYKISSNEVSFLIEKYLLNKKSISKYFENKKYFVNNLDSNSKNSIKITIEKFDVTFLKIKDLKDSVQRKFHIKLSILFSDENSVTSTFEIEKQFSDSLNFDCLEFANSVYFGFAKAEIPEKKLSFWKKYFEPAIVVASAAIVTTLFFLVRSK
jgi:hypothetical protein